ncbi:uncharacterized protein LOC132197609 [Neocloeon triangulifer]|uniref:uncharacterized protein LOC132197609 n=1 Tax=Neocloeon triangulifer TaxID=2078957 RepID=UPI00286F8D74|nr:uncharacterized protein LOC132197609 [Neocloeon triangulifer]
MRSFVIVSVLAFACVALGQKPTKAPDCVAADYKKLQSCYDPDIVPIFDNKTTQYKTAFKTCKGTADTTNYMMNFLLNKMFDKKTNTFNLADKKIQDKVVDQACIFECIINQTGQINFPNGTIGKEALEYYIINDPNQNPFWGEKFSGYFDLCLQAITNLNIPKFVNKQKKMCDPKWLLMTQCTIFKAWAQILDEVYVYNQTIDSGVVEKWDVKAICNTTLKTMHTCRTGSFFEGLNVD